MAGLGAYFWWVSTLPPPPNESASANLGPLPAVMIIGGAVAAVIGGVQFATGHPGATYDGQGTVWEVKGPSTPPAQATPVETSSL
ncbi:MAG: hypothetical protein ACRENE_34000 [Polyangiaceae bacterium]